MTEPAGITSVDGKAQRPDSESPSGWLLAGQRLRRYSTSALALLLVLGALAGLYARDGVREWRLQDERVRTATAGQAVTMAGARWELIELRELRASELAAADPLPNSVKLVRVRIALTPSSRAASKRIRGCTVRVYDARGRYWVESDHVPFGITPTTETDSCTPGFDKLLAPGETVELLDDVAVPAKAHGLRAAVALPGLATRRQPPQVAKFPA